MKYLSITQKTAEWLQNDSVAQNILKRWLAENFDYDEELNKGVAYWESLRITSIDNTVLCIWNNDYIEGTGEEKWGIIRLSGELGLLGKKDRLNQTLDDFLFTINKRLQGLIIDHPTKKHKSLSNNLHFISSTSLKDTYGIVCKDITTVTKGKLGAKTVICTGTAASIHQHKQIEQVEEDERIVNRLLELSNDAILKSKTKPALDILNLSQRFRKPNVEFDEIHDAPPLSEEQTLKETQYSTLDYTYEDWTRENGPLNETQSAILNAGILNHRPLRIIGAAGTGKSLLMQLLAAKRLLKAEQEDKECHIIYVCHSTDMVNNVYERFDTLGVARFILNEEGSKQKLEINTLFQYCYQSSAEIPSEMILSTDAYQNKEFQKDCVARFLGETIEDYDRNKLFYNKALPVIEQLKEANARESLVDVICNEIGVAIKGRTEGNVRQFYTEAEAPLSRFHNALNVKERNFVFEIYTKYKNYLSVEEGFLDSDDVAISFLQTRRTPVWELRRKKEGFDYVFVDETQLFNENERQLFSYLTKKNNPHVPIALALDEAQDLKGGIHKGFGILGITELEDKRLKNVHRCTKDILQLAFYVIQRTTDLFGSEFPDFTKNTVSLVNDDHSKIKFPIIKIAKNSLDKELLDTISELRSSNLRQVCVIVHANKYWEKIQKLLKNEELGTFIIIDRRGEKMPKNKPFIALSRPESVGGQEFDAVISIGLEDGLVPEKVSYAPLSVALEQQALREIYLSFTRAKYQLISLISLNSSPSIILKDAHANGLISFK